MWLHSFVTVLVHYSSAQLDFEYIIIQFLPVSVLRSSCEFLLPSTITSSTVLLATS
jgi:hypothetical protein